MFYSSTPPLDGTTPETGPNSFPTGFDFANQFHHSKSTVMASPNTDSLEGDLSTSSGGVLRESLPQSYLSPSSVQVMNLHGSNITRRLSTDARNAAAGGANNTSGNSHPHQLNSHHNNSSSINNSSINNFGEGSPLFHFVPTATALDDAEDAEEDKQLLDYAGLESLLMAAVGDGSSGLTPMSQSRNSATAASAAAALSALYDVAPQTTMPLAVSSTANHAQMERSTGSVSPVPSRGSNSVPLSGSSPNMYSAESAFLYSNFDPELINSRLPPPQMMKANEDNANVMGSTSPQMMTMAPVRGVADFYPLHPGSAIMNTSGNASHSAASTTGGNMSFTSQPPTSDSEVRSNLFVCGLPMTVTDKDLLDVFGKYGPIESAKVMLDIHTGRSRGIAFVKFTDVEHAENAIDTLNGMPMNGHPITVRVANSRAAFLPGNPTNKTFVRNVPLAVSRSTLMEYFSKFGEVTDLSIKSDTAQGRHHHGGGSRTSSAPVDAAEEKLNIVFITYSTKEAAARAAEATHTKAPFKECNGVPLLAKVAEDTTRRMERLSRRVRTVSGMDSKEVSTTGSTAAMSLSYASLSGLQPGMMVVPVTTAAAAATCNGCGTGGGGNGLSGATYVTVPSVTGADLTALTMVQTNGLPQPTQQPAPPQMSVLHDANGNLIYAAAAAAAAPPPAQTGVSYCIPGGFPQASLQQHQQQQHQQQQHQQQQPPPPPQQQQPPPPPPQQQNVFFTTHSPPPPQQQQAMYMQAPNGVMASPAQQFQLIQPPPPQQTMQLQGAQGQIMYVRTSNGSVVPVVFNGAALAGPAQAQGVGSYYVVMNN
ncbi:hypothetical protein ABB37_05718 [Leptomonas pyrrhocoris]|uniref:RRM domain-containing protein n=1 Tax=Leptomonas pyrrhocoris TaxID=157538 RepID=A0A0M9FZR4_LEPPY|nr:hypothetical protein ABB37_05718 [Leptomonas pyrrhocoris]KPA79237.1 hypothetical protein ABB37_05718 [Leptomonas pyrrhocoris]|eukprot:XP_015657676.1 hypothetical protein ABB37_05718 [Leptomonas pyrrhocoris]